MSTIHLIHHFIAHITFIYLGQCHFMLLQVQLNLHNLKSH